MPDPLTAREERLLRFARAMDGGLAFASPVETIDRLLATIDAARATPAAPQPDAALCPATQQTETWGLMWCGLFAGHEPRDHAWFSEDQHHLRSTPAAPDPVADVLLVRERDQPQPDAGSRIGPCTSEDGEHDWQPGPAWCARCQPQPDTALTVERLAEAIRNHDHADSTIALSCDRGHVDRCAAAILRDLGEVEP